MIIYTMLKGVMGGIVDHFLVEVHIWEQRKEEL